MRLHILFVWFISFKLFFVEFTRFLFVLLIFLLRKLFWSWYNTQFLGDRIRVRVKVSIFLTGRDDGHRD